MKIPVIIIPLLFSALLSTAQIERKPAVVKTDSTTGSLSAGTNTKMNRKDRLKELDLTREQKIKLKEIRQSNQAAK